MKVVAEKNSSYTKQGRVKCLETVSDSRVSNNCTKGNCKKSYRLLFSHVFLS